MSSPTHTPASQPPRVANEAGEATRPSGDSPKRQGDKLRVAAEAGAPGSETETAVSADSPKRQGDKLDGVA